MTDASDPITDAIAENATSPSSMSGDGVSVTNNSIESQIKAKQFLDANNALAGIANGTAWFPRMRVAPPGAGGNSHDDC